MSRISRRKGHYLAENVAPFTGAPVSLAGADGMPVYEQLKKADIEVLYDDRDISAGQKFTEADLLGIPWRLVISPKAGDGKIDLSAGTRKKQRSWISKKLFGFCGGTRSQIHLFVPA